MKQSAKKKKKKDLFWKNKQKTFISFLNEWDFFKKK